MSLMSCRTHFNDGETYSLFVRVDISDAKVVFLQQVEMVADEVKQVLTLCIPLRRQRREKVHAQRPFI